MIRIHLGSEGLGNVRIRALPDFDAELTAAGADRARSGRLPGPLAQLYSRDTSPDLAEGVGPAYLSHLFIRRSPTPFTRALANGDDRAHGMLAGAVDRLRGAAVEPHLSGVAAAVAARAAGLTHLYAGGGASALLDRLGAGIRLRGGVLEVPTAFDADLELGRRALRIQPVALSRRAALAEPADEHLTVRIPAGAPPRAEPGRLPALRSLLGDCKAETLLAIVGCGGVSGRQLASMLGVSEAAASRRVAVLRQAGLIRSERTGQAVKHVATPLGHHLAASEPRGRTAAT